MLDPGSDIPFYELPMCRACGNLAQPTEPNYGQATTIVEAETKTLQFASTLQILRAATQTGMLQLLTCLSNSIPTLVW